MTNTNTRYPELAKRSLKDIQNRVREIVEAEPHRVYDPPGKGVTCYYAWEGKPSCLLGRAMFDVGVPLAELIKMDKEDEGDIMSSGIADVLAEAFGGFDDQESRDIVNWLDSVQSSQDARLPYGDCVFDADHPEYTDDDSPQED